MQSIGKAQEKHRKAQEKHRKSIGKHRKYREGKEPIMDSNKRMISKSDPERGRGSRSIQKDNDSANKLHEPGDIAKVGRPSTSSEGRFIFLTPIQEYYYQV